LAVKTSLKCSRGARGWELIEADLWTTRTTEYEADDDDDEM
jgi:hypothetical protein